MSFVGDLPKTGSGEVPKRPPRAPFWAVPAVRTNTSIPTAKGCDPEHTSYESIYHWRAPPSGVHLSVVSRRRRNYPEGGEGR